MSRITDAVRRLLDATHAHPAGDYAAMGPFPKPNPALPGRCIAREEITGMACNLPPNHFGRHVGWDRDEGLAMSWPGNRN